MRNIISTIIMVIGWIFMTAAFLFDLYCAYHIMGFIGIAVGIVLFPVLLAAVPFYMLFKYGVILSMVLTGAGVICLVISAFVAKD